MKLLCTYTSIDSIESDIKSIINTYSLTKSKIYVFNIQPSDEYICTYNVDNINKMLSNTFLIHRKKDYNVMYTINALNYLILELNNNILDDKFNIDWSKYENKIITLCNNKVKISETFLKSIIML